MSDRPVHALPRGFRAAATRAGIKPSGGLDLAVLVADGPCAAAGTFTTNRVCAAPVKWDRGSLPSDGDPGRRHQRRQRQRRDRRAGRGERPKDRRPLAAERLGCRPDDVLVASTGVIGHQLPMDRLEAGLARRPRRGPARLARASTRSRGRS